LEREQALEAFRPHPLAADAFEHGIGTAGFKFLDQAGAQQITGGLAGDNRDTHAGLPLSKGPAGPALPSYLLADDAARAFLEKRSEQCDIRHGPGLFRQALPCFLEAQAGAVQDLVSPLELANLLGGAAVTAQALAVDGMG